MREIDARVVLLALLAGAITVAGGTLGGPVAVFLALVAGAATARAAFGAEEPVVIVAVLLGGMAILATLDDGRVPAAVAAMCVFTGSELAAAGRVFAADTTARWGPALANVGITVLAAAVAVALVSAISVVHASPAIAASAGAALLVLAIVAVLVRSRSQAGRAAPGNRADHRG